MTTKFGGARTRKAFIGMLVSGGLLSACGHKQRDVEPLPAPPVVAPMPTTAPASNTVLPTPNLPADERFTLVLNLLSQGKEAQARADLVQYLADRPRDARAKDMLRQVDTDAAVLYGTASYPYTIAEEDTLASIAQRFMGSRYRFYGLAKFNGLVVPAQAKPGQVIQIPGRPRPAPVRRSKPMVQLPREEAQPASVTAPAARPVVDRGGAQRLRRAGLEQMSAGAIDRSVTLLERAAALDPGNGAIAGDLARARRIQGTVRSRN